MGTWDELDIELTVENDLTGLDDLITECMGSEFDDVFEPAIEIAEDLKDAIDEGSQLGLEIISEMTKDTESNEISNPSKHPYAQGILASSIQIEGSEYQYTIGTDLNHIYPMSVELGADIYPVNKSKLKFQLLNGEIIYADEVHIPPNPFVEPTFERSKRLIDNGVGVFSEVCKAMDNVMKG